MNWASVMGPELIRSVVTPVTIRMRLQETLYQCLPGGASGKGTSKGKASGQLHHPDLFSTKEYISVEIMYLAYVLLHQSTVAASSLPSDDDKKFRFVHCSYQELFLKVTTDAEMVKARELTWKLEQHIDSKTVLRSVFVCT